MNKRELLEILHDWNFWKNELDTGKERKAYLEKCLRFLKTNVVTAIIGVRRAGKSYIMRQTIKELIEKGTERKDTLMINFEDKRFAEFYPELLDEIYETYLEFLKPGKKPFVFLDKIHNVPKWERWVRTSQELGKAKIIISGSSSKLLAGELATVLTGRHLDVFVFPLSFAEFLYFNNLEITDELDRIAKKIEIKRFFGEYFEFGGFPEVVLSGDKKQLLLTYFDDVLTKDIERRYKLKKGEKLRALARFYLTNISNPITFNSLKTLLGTTTNTIENFSSYLEEAGMIFFVKRFSFKVKEQEKSARKVYSIDVGLANAVGFKFSSGFGKIAENLVAIELKRRETTDPNVELYYWKNPRHEEVDFLIKEGLKVKQLIQVCWNINEYKTKEREIRALLKASKEVKCENLLVITEDYEAEEEIKIKDKFSCKVEFLPLWKWLLENPMVM
ncbi:MAG TPA: ATPase [Methanophagales archaeon]|nr:ATPase [Methanophagales archaeon]